MQVQNVTKLGRRPVCQQLVLSSRLLFFFPNGPFYPPAEPCFVVTHLVFISALSLCPCVGGPNGTWREEHSHVHTHAMHTVHSCYARGARPPAPCLCTFPTLDDEEDRSANVFAAADDSHLKRCARSQTQITRTLSPFTFPLSLSLSFPFSPIASVLPHSCSSCHTRNQYPSSCARRWTCLQKKYTVRHPI